MIFDVHNDLLTVKSGRDLISVLNNFAVESLKGLVAAIWTSELGDDIDAKISRLTQPIKALKTPFKLCYAIEDLHFITENALESFDFSFYKYCSLTWNFQNNLACGCKTAGGLKALGKRVLKAMENARCAVDTAHLNVQSFWDVASNAQHLINSHTAFYAVNKHYRNIDDNQIKEIILRGGIIGLCLVCEFLGGDRLENVVRMIDYFTQRFGAKALAVGTDFYGTDNLPAGLTDYSGFKRLRYALENMGYGSKDIDAIFYKNAYDYFIGD